MNDRARHLLAEVGYFTVILVATVLLFWRVVFHHDRTFLTWYDNVVQYYAWMHRVVDGWRQLTPPLWDFTTNSGTSFVGELQTAVFYPLNILFAWTIGDVSPAALDRFIVLHFALGWAGMAVFLRTLGLSRPAALLGGALFMLCGPVFGRASGQANIFVALVYVPWALACFARACRHGPATHPLALAAGICLGVALLAGHPQPFVHGVAAVLAFSIWVWLQAARRERRTMAVRIAGGLLVAAGAALLTAAIQIVPSYEYFGRAFRWVGLADPVHALSVVPAAARAKYQIDWQHLHSILDGTPSGPDGATLYVTIGGLVLAAIGLIGTNRLRWLGAGLALGSVGLALGSNTPVGWLNEYMPGLRSVREPARILCLYQLGMATLAALGFDYLSARHRGWFHRMALGGLVALFLFQAADGINAMQAVSADPHAPAEYYGHPAIAALRERLTADHHLYRAVVRPTDLLPPNVGHVHGIATVVGHSSSMRSEYFTYLSQDWTPGSPSFDRLGVKYAVADAALDNFTSASTFDRAHLLVRDAALPVFQFESRPSERNALPIETVEWGINKVALRYRVADSGHVIFAQLSYPGWRASLDGDAVAVSRAADGFMSVATRAGDHTLTLRYSPWWLPVGFALWSLVGLALLACVLRFARRSAA